MAANRGCGIVLASNDPGFVAATCDRVAFLLEGRKMAEGSPSELVAGLDRPVAIEVELAPGSDASPSVETAPPGITVLSGRGELLTFASDEGTAALPSLCEWLASGGHTVRSIRLREPDLSDVFLSLTGVPLDRAEAGEPS